MYDIMSERIKINIKFLRGAKWKIIIKIYNIQMMKKQ